MFRYSGVIVFSLEKYSADTLELEVLESGADDFRLEEEVFLVITSPENLQAVRAYFEGKNLIPESAELGYLPTQTAELSPDDIEKYTKLKGLIEDHMDIQAVWDNLT